jgi:hypothetical protein
MIILGGWSWESERCGYGREALGKSDFGTHWRNKEFAISTTESSLHMLTRNYSKSYKIYWWVNVEIHPRWIGMREWDTERDANVSITHMAKYIIIFASKKKKTMQFKSSLKAAKEIKLIACQWWRLSGEVRIFMMQHRECESMTME